MHDEQEDTPPSVGTSLKATIFVPIVMMLGIVGIVTYFFGNPVIDYFTDRNQIASSSLQTDDIKVEDICLNEVVAERVAALVAEQVSKRKIDRADPFDQIDGLRAFVQAFQMQQGVLTSPDEFLDRISVGSITFDGHNQASNTIRCTATVSMTDLSSESDNGFYKAQPRVGFQIQQLVDGSDVIVSIDNSTDIMRAGFSWAMAEGQSSRAAAQNNVSADVVDRTVDERYTEYLSEPNGREAKCVFDGEAEACAFVPASDGSFDIMTISGGGYNFKKVSPGLVDVTFYGAKPNPLGRFTWNDTDKACWDGADQQICIY